MQLISHSISTWEAAAALPEGHGCDSGHGGHQQSPSVQDCGSRKVSIHWDPGLPASSMAGTGILPFPVSLRAHPDLRSCLSPAAVPGAGGLLHIPEVTGPSCQSLPHSWEFPFQLSFSCGSVIPSICLVAQSTDNGRFLPCPAAGSKGFICDFTKYLLCFKTKGKGMPLLCNLIQVLEESCWAPC